MKPWQIAVIAVALTLLSVVTFARTDMQSPATISVMPKADGYSDILVSIRTDESGTKTQQQNDQIESLISLVQL